VHIALIIGVCVVAAVVGHPGDRPPPRRRSTRGPSGGIPATWAAARNCDESAAGGRSGRCRYFRSASAGTGRRRGPARRSSPARRPGVPRRAGPRSRARGPTRCRPTRAACCVSSSWKPAIPTEPAEHRDSPIRVTRGIPHGEVQGRGRGRPIPSPGTGRVARRAPVSSGASVITTGSIEV
jgi:hypothetical protein